MDENPEIFVPEIIEEGDGEMLPEEDGLPVEDLPETGILSEEELIEESVAFINRTVAEMVVNATLKIGDYLLDRFFNNDIELASSMNGHKSISYSRLCRRPDLSLTRRQLGIAVRVSAQEKFFAIMQVDAGRLHYTKKTHLTMLPNSQVKADLARECINQNMSASKLYARIRQINQAALPYVNPNEKIVNGYKKTMKRLITGSAIPELLATQEGLYRLERETLLQLRNDVAGWISGLEAKLEEYARLIAQVDYTVAHPNY